MAHGGSAPPCRFDRAKEGGDSGFDVPCWPLGMTSSNLYALLRSRFPREPGALCLLPEAGEALSYTEVDLQSARLAGRLHGLGVRPGERILAQVPKSPAAVILYLACLRAGFVYVPLNDAYTDEEVRAFLVDAEPRLLVCDPARAPGLAAAARKAGVDHLLDLDAEGGGSLWGDGSDAPLGDVHESVEGDVAALLYTSGTTGRPKGAMLTHANLASNALALHALWGFEAGERVLHALPLYHAHGLFVALHTALLNASPIRLLPRFDAARVVARLPEAAVFMGVPTHYTRLLERPELDRACCRSLRVCVSGSAPLLARTHAEFEARTGQRILERYGMTETGMITSNPWRGDRVPGTVGYALPGVEVRVVGESGAPLPDGEVGVLEVRGPNVCAGYWGMPERTRQEFRADGFFITGDLACRATDGRIRLVGRARDLVISGGLNVHPAEVERELDALPGVRESAVIGAPHPDFGEGVVAVVVSEGARPGEAELREALSGRLASFKQPKRIFFQEALPRNAMGKVRKEELRDLYAGVFEGEP
ncbi:MAG: AMP-binding protein [Myxococcota bacterium]